MLKETFLNNHIIDRLIEKDNSYSFFSREEVIKYLKFWNRTYWNNSTSLDIISYEELIFLENKFEEDEEIQNLIWILKKRIAKIYDLKIKWLDDLVDKKIFNTEVYRGAKNYGLYLHNDQIEVEEEAWR